MRPNRSSARPSKPALRLLIRLLGRSLNDGCLLPGHGWAWPELKYPGRSKMTSLLLDDLQSCLLGSIFNKSTNIAVVPASMDLGMLFSRRVQHIVQPVLVAAAVLQEEYSGFRVASVQMSHDVGQKLDRRRCTAQSHGLDDGIGLSRRRTLCDGGRIQQNNIPLYPADFAGIDDIGRAECQWPLHRCRRR